MKKFFLIFCVFVVSQSRAQELSGSVETEGTVPVPTAISVNYVDSLVLHARKTAANTEPEIIFNTTWDYRFLWIFSVIAGMLAVPSLVFDLKTAEWTKKTARNTKEINKQAQEARFKDLIRHLYRNMVCVYAMHWKLMGNGFGKYYPSEEHLLKLKMLPEDLRLDRFDSYTPEHYDKLHKLEFIFRNYSIEIDVTLEHLKLRSLPDDVKIADLRTLEFKSQYMTKEICELMNSTGMPIDDGVVGKILRREFDRQKTVEKENYDRDNVPPREGEKYRYYDDVLGLAEQLDEDISREYGVIKLIEFTA